MNVLAGADTALADATPPPPNAPTVTEERPGTQAGWSPATPVVRATLQTEPPKKKSMTALWLALAVLGVGGIVATVIATRTGAAPAIAELPPLPPKPAGTPPPEAPPSAKAKVTAALERAREADGKGDLEEALTAYQAAYTIDPSAETTYAIGELHERLGHKDDAVRFYERYLMAAKDAPNKDSVTKKIAQLQSTAKPAVASTPKPAKPVEDKTLRPCHCIPQDHRDTVSMCAKKGPSMCRCTTNRGTSLCPTQVTKCPDCPDGTQSCWPKGCSSEGFQCAEPNFDKQRTPGKHGDACIGYEVYGLGPQLTGTLDCDHCDDVPEPRQFRGHEGDECTGFYRSTGEKLKGWLICY
jgi:hypothetical protein